MLINLTVKIKIKITHHKISYKTAYLYDRTDSYLGR